MSVVGKRRTQVGKGLLTIAAGYALATWSSTAQVRGQDLSSRAAYMDVLVRTARGPVLPYAAQGDLTALIMAKPGHAREIADLVREWGGQIQYELPAISYLRVQIPSTRWSTLQSTSAIEAAVIDQDGGFFAWTELAPQEARDAPAVPSPPSTPSPPASPEPTVAPEHIRAWSGETRREIGLDRFRRAMPTADGRGSTIAIVDALMMTHPAFSRTLDLDGHTVPKIRDVLVQEPGWREINDIWSGVSHDLWIWVDGERLRLPKVGAFSVGRAIVAGRAYWCAWQNSPQRAWIDLNQNNRFGDDGPAIEDTRETGATVSFPAVETWPNDNAPWAGGDYRLTFSNDGHALLLHAGKTRHSTMVGSIAAGSDVDDNLTPGIAPGATLVVIDPLGTSSAAPLPHLHLEALMTAATTPHVDAVVTSVEPMRNIPHTSDEFEGLIIDRLTAAFDVLIVDPADNGYGPESASPGGTLGISAGAYTSPQAARAFYNVQTAAAAVAPFSSRGPLVDGAMRPDVVAPANWVTAAGCHERGPRTKVAEGSLPPCYQVSGGTSSAAPVIAGMAALLRSAGRQRGIEFHAADLRWALRASAQALPGAQAIDQGTGVPQLDVAWQLLQRVADRRHITSRAPVVHVLQDALRKPDSGPGLYEREGWKAGDEGTRSIELTRLDGPDAAEDFELVWISNDGTFASDDRIALRRGVPAKVSVRVRARAVGVHSALLALRDTQHDMLVTEIPCTIVVGDRFTRRGQFKLETSATLRPYDQFRYAFYVAPGTQALNFAIDVSARTQWLLYEPAGWMYHRINVGPHLGFSPLDGPRTHRFSLPQPAPGTWIMVATTPPPAFTTESLCRVEITAVKTATSAITSSDELRLTLNNQMGSLEQINASASVGTSLTITRPFDRNEPVAIPFQFEPSTTWVQWRAHTLYNKGGLELYLYQCSEQAGCLRYDAAVPALPEQIVTITRPRDAHWIVVIAPTDAAQGFELQRVMTSPRLGAAAATASWNGRLASGRSTTLIYRPSLQDHIAGEQPVLVFNFKPTSAHDDDGHGEITLTGWTFPLRTPGSITAESTTVGEELGERR